MKLEVTYKLPKKGFVIQIPGAGQLFVSDDYYTVTFDDEQQAFEFYMHNDSILEMVSSVYVDEEEPARDN